jgi:hypothetical protein
MSEVPRPPFPRPGPDAGYYKPLPTYPFWSIRSSVDVPSDTSLYELCCLLGVSLSDEAAEVLGRAYVDMGEDPCLHLDMTAEEQAPIFADYERRLAEAREHNARAEVAKRQRSTWTTYYWLVGEGLDHPQHSSELERYLEKLA